MRVGVAGLGFMGATHISSVSCLRDITVAAVCGGDEKRLNGDFREVGGNLGGGFGVLDFSYVRKCASWEELVADESLEAIDICLPTEFHAPVALAAMAKGKHVLCEKPMALTGEDCDAMRQAAADSRRTLMIGQVLRFFPSYRRLQSAVRSGELGAVRAATFVRRCGVPQWSKWLTDEKRSGGAILDLLIHDIDQALWLFGVPDRVAAKSLGSVDTVMATFLYEGGPEVRIQGGWFAPEMPFSMSFQVRFERGELELTADGLMLSDMSGRREKLALEASDPYQKQIAYFVDCCRRGVQPEWCLPEESANAVKVALLMKESRERGGEQVQCLV